MTDVKVIKININDICVNKDNARHGSLASEKEAIEWLLSNKKSRLESLAKDIAETGTLFERPLVKQATDGKYIVYDGNRRVTCLKLLHNPNYTENEYWVKFFSTLKDNNSNIPIAIECDVCADITFINDWVERKHIGGESGKGQLKWDKTEKENHLLLTGKKSTPQFAIHFQNELRKKGIIAPEETLKHSLFIRLLSNKNLKERVGFKVDDDIVSYIKNEEEVLNAIAKMHNDFTSGKETLNTLWNNEAKIKYLDRLEKEGYITPYSKTDSVKNTIKSKKSSKSPTVKLANSLSIIDIDFPITAKTNEEIKIKGIWDEMQNRLNSTRHPYSLGVMTRVLLELSTDYCAEKHNLKCNKKDPLHTKLIKVIEYLYNNGNLSKNDADKLKGTANPDILNLHSYVHDLNAHPTQKDLIALWGKYKKYIKLCLTY